MCAGGTHAATPRNSSPRTEFGRLTRSSARPAGARPSTGSSALAANTRHQASAAAACVAGAIRFITRGGTGGELFAAGICRSTSDRPLSHQPWGATLTGIDEVDRRIESQTLESICQFDCRGGLVLRQRMAAFQPARLSTRASCCRQRMPPSTVAVAVSLERPGFCSLRWTRSETVNGQNPSQAIEPSSTPFSDDLASSTVESARGLSASPFCSSSVCFCAGRVLRRLVLSAIGGLRRAETFESRFLGNGLCDLAERPAESRRGGINAGSAAVPLGFGRPAAIEPPRFGRERAANRFQECRGRPRPVQKGDRQFPELKRTATNGQSD